MGALCAAGDDPPRAPDPLLRLRADHEATIGDLVKVASDQKELSAKRQIALDALGDYHSATAISCLLDNLLFDEAIVSQTHPLATYPAAMSLSRIGSPSYPQIWQRLNRECSDKYLFVFAHTIFKIDGKAVALARLEEKYNSPDTTKEQVANLGKSIDLFKNVDFKRHKNWP